jgi:hypothetical protein
VTRNVENLNRVDSCFLPSLRITNYGLLFCFLLAFCGCATGPKVLVKDFHAPSKVAVLLFNNETNDVDAPETVRKALIGMLPSNGYSPISKEEVDRILQEEFGITDGGQLPSVTSQELGEKLGVKGLFYGNVVTFQDLVLGFARKRTVKADLKLIDAKSGDLLWEDEKSWTTPEFHGPKEVKEATIRMIAERQLEKMTGTFLKKETELAINLMLKNLPSPTE